MRTQDAPEQASARRSPSPGADTGRALSRRDAARALAVTGFAPIIAALGGCNEGSGMSAGASSRLVMASASAPVSVSLESIEGGSDAARARFAERLSAEATTRRIGLTAPADGAEAARYRLKAYLAASSGEEGGLAVTAVLDVFDAERRRAQRVNASSAVRGAGASDDPAALWARVDGPALERLAADGMNGVAAFLAGGAG